MVGNPNSQSASRARAAVVIAVIVAAVFMSNLDLWIVNVALVDIGHDFGGSLANVSWVLNAYAVTLAALLIPAGRWGDRIGQRTVFLFGVALFTVASLACALAPNLAVLVIARIAQAAGAAAQLPTSLALLLAGVAPAARMKAARGWAAVGALSAVCGPVFGGLLVTASWRWVFVINVPIGVAAVVIGRRLLPVTPPREREPVPDPVGTGLLIITLAALTGALVQAPTWGWGSAATIGLFVLAAVGLAGFVWRCGRTRNPAVELHLLRVRRFARANIATFAFSAAFAIMLLAGSLWCQDVWHYSALRTGLAMAPGPAMVPLVTFGSSGLVHRLGPGRVAAIGSVIFGGGMLWLVYNATVARDYAHGLLPSMLLGGIGVGFAMGTLIATAATSLPGNRAATASAFVNSGRQIASAVGVAILVSVLAAHAGLRGFQIGWWIAAGLAFAAAAASLTLRPEMQPSAAIGDAESRTASTVEVAAP